MTDAGPGFRFFLFSVNHNESKKKLNSKTKDPKLLPV